MSTQAASAAGSGNLTVVTVVAADTYISSALTEPVKAQLPAGSEMTDGAEIRFECTGGSLMVIETEEGRYVGVVPGDGQAVVVYEPGNDSNDFWRFVLLAQSPAAQLTGSARADRVEHLLVTLPAIAGAGIDLAAAYADADWDTETDVSIDAQFDLLDTATAAAFAEVETAMNAFILVLEAITTISA